MKPTREKGGHKLSSYSNNLAPVYSEGILDYNERNIYIRYLIKQLCERYFIKRPQLARVIGISPNNLINFLSAQRNFSSQRLSLVENTIIDYYSISPLKSLTTDLRPLVNQEILPLPERNNYFRKHIVNLQNNFFISRPNLARYVGETAHVFSNFVSGNRRFGHEKLDLIGDTLLELYEEPILPNLVPDNEPLNEFVDYIINQKLVKAKFVKL